MVGTIQQREKHRYVLHRLACPEEAVRKALLYPVLPYPKGTPSARYGTRSRKVRRREYRRCPQCGGHFPPRRSDAKYCSPACRSLAYYHRQNLTDKRQVGLPTERKNLTFIRQVGLPTESRRTRRIGSVRRPRASTLWGGRPGGGRLAGASDRLNRRREMPTRATSPDPAALTAGSLHFRPPAPRPRVRGERGSARTPPHAGRTRQATTWGRRERHPGKRRPGRATGRRHTTFPRPPIEYNDTASFSILLLQRPARIG